jgi:hypothetical protein
LLSAAGLRVQALIIDFGDALEQAVRAFLIS